jgi:steroid delta-isomerase-like uncharacterized protein
MKHRSLAVFSIVVLAACGGESEAVAPPAAPTTTPPPATVTAPPATAPTTADTTPAPTPKPPMIEMQKKNAAAFLAAFNAHDAKGMAAAYAPDGVSAAAGPGGWMEMKGREAIEKGNADLFVGYPDAKMSAERFFADKDVVVVQWVMTGTNNGDFMGQKATKKPIGFHGVSVLWFNDDGVVKKEHAYYDVPTIMSQQGNAPKGTPKMRAAATLPTGDAQWITPADEKNVAAYKAEMEAFGKHDPKALLANASDDFMMTDYSSPADVKGKPANIKEMGNLFKAFPDMTGTCDNLWGFGDAVICEMSAGGTMKGSMMGMKPTNKPVTVHRLEIEWYKDGKANKMEAYMNGMEPASQMMPPPPPAKTAATAASGTAKPAATGATPPPKTTGSATPPPKP